VLNPYISIAVNLSILRFFFLEIATLKENIRSTCYPLPNLACHQRHDGTMTNIYF